MAYLILAFCWLAYIILQGALCWGITNTIMNIWAGVYAIYTNIEKANAYNMIMLPNIIGGRTQIRDAETDDLAAVVAKNIRYLAILFFGQVVLLSLVLVGYILSRSTF